MRTVELAAHGVVAGTVGRKNSIQPRESCRRKSEIDLGVCTDPSEDIYIHFKVLVMITLSSHRQINVLSVMVARKETNFLILSINVA